MYDSKHEEEEKKFEAPVKLQATYTNFKLFKETSSYNVFEANAYDSGEKHLIRILDRSKEFVNNAYSRTATLFVQELLHLQYRCPGSVLTHTFEISDDGQQISCATLPYLPIDSLSERNEEGFDPKDPQLVSKLIADVLSDVEFLSQKLQMKQVIDRLGSENLCFMKNKEGAFFLGNWSKYFETEPNASSTTADDGKEDSLNSQKEMAETIKALAMTILKLNNIDTKVVDKLLQMKESNPEIYDFGIDRVLKQHQENPELQNLIREILSVEASNLPNLDEFRSKMQKLHQPVQQSPEKSQLSLSDGRLSVEGANLDNLSDGRLSVEGVKQVNRLRLIEVDPKDAVTFKYTPNEASFAYAKITNITDDTVAFQVKTTKPDSYLVTPSNGIITPGKFSEIKFKVKKYDPNAIGINDKFLIVAIRLPPDQNPFLIPELLKTTTAENKHQIKLGVNQLNLQTIKTS